METRFTSLWTVSFITLFVASARAGQAVPYPRALTRADITLTALDEPINDALILGNGDLNGLLFAEGDDLVFRVTKNDVWDARIDTKLDPPLPTLRRLKELAEGDWPDRNWILPKGSTWKGPDSYSAHAYPCPRACAVVKVTGAAGGPLVGRLDIRRGLADIYARQRKSRVFVAADSNAIVIATNPPANVALEPIHSDDIPSPKQGQTGDTTWVTQEIPGDLDWPGMGFAVACTSKNGRAAVALVTSRESDTPLESAITLAEKALQRPQAEIENAHTDAWESFWTRSGIDIADPVMERVWYRNLYFLRCVSKPGVVSTGLFAGLLDDKPAWHGDYHTNYNIQQTYWSAFAANQCELAEPYDRLISAYLSRARWLAKRIFDCKGAFFPHVLYAYEPSDPAKCKSPNGRQYFHHVWAWTLGVTGFTVQPLWWKYKYQPEADYLQNVAYPAVRDVAVFYADFVSRCEKKGDKVVLAPTVSPEHWGWTPNFQRNRNCAFDIAMFHFIFDAAIEGARTLKRDQNLIEQWQAAQNLLPDYPVHTSEPKVVVDVEGAPPITYNIPVPTTPIFPCDQIDRLSPQPVRELFRKTLENLRHNGNNAPVMLAVARARLGTPDAYDWLRTELERRERRNGTLSFNRLDPRFRFNDFGHYTEMFGAALPVTELLLQSVKDVIRVFPAWPKWLPARFHTLRAQGGFLVSAELAGGRVKSIEIESTAGQELHLFKPWKHTQGRLAADADWQSLRADDRGIIRLKTKQGQRLAFRPRPVWEQIRAQGQHNIFRREGDATVMRIRGRKEASTGYRMPIRAKGFSALTFELKGSPNAQYFVEIVGSSSPSIARTGWKPSPQQWTKESLAIPASQAGTAIMLYTWTTDGKEAFNAFRSLELTGPAGKRSIDLTALE